MRRPTLEVLKSAYGRFAVGAFNVCNLEQIQGLFQGAADAGAPVIAQFTRAIRDYADPLMLDYMLRAAETIWPDVQLAVHLDHGDESACFQAIESGRYNSVMIDASHLPFEENVAITARVVRQAHGAGLAVEAELGRLIGIEDGMGEEVKEAILTDPHRAAEFVQQTGCDALAVAVGTSHGAYKFPGKQGLHLDRLREIQKQLPGLPLVLHGGSGIPDEEVARINAAGGALHAGASGVTQNELAAAVKLGITKVNIGTDGRLIWTRVHREFFRDRPADYDFMIPGKTYVNAFKDFVVRKCRALGWEQGVNAR